MYYVGIYLLYYLSRTREYLADAFSAEHVEARHLAAALVKIAYGIVQGGGHRGDAEAAAEHAAHGRHRREERALRPASTPRALARAPARRPRRCCSTRYNPWARLIELNSTHPLTGMRISHLGDIAKQKAQPFPDYDLQGRGAARAPRQGRAVEPVLAGARHALASRVRRGLLAARCSAPGCSSRLPPRSACSSRCRCAIPRQRRRRPTVVGADDQSCRLARRRPPGAARPARRSAAPIPASSPARTSSTRTRPAC